MGNVLLKIYRMTATTNLRRCFVLAGLMVVTSFARAQEIAITVTGEVKTPLKLGLAEIREMPGMKVTAKDHDGTTASYEGVALQEILRRAGVPQGESLRGDALTLCLLVKAADGYNVLFALTELDSLFTDRQVLLAYRRDDKPLEATAGPLRL